MKTVVLNGSPRMSKGNTGMVLEAFIEGMEDAGAEVELYYPDRLNIHPCACGQMHCWYGKPGECVYTDDMQRLYASIRAAKILVLATPVYIPLPGAMQNAVNRLCPLIVPQLVQRDGRTRARFREDVGIERIALLATGGWWEKQNFNILVRIAEELAENGSVAFGGAVLRPHAFLMKAGGKLTEAGRVVLEQVRAAGSELVRDGVMNPETLATIARPLVTEAELRERYNRML